MGFSFGAPEQSTATVEIHGICEIDHVVVHHAGADVGQGAHTVMMQMAAETLAVPTEKIHLVVSDTAFTQDSGSTSASRMTFMAGNSIKGACLQALEKWKAEERPAISTFQYKPPRTTPYDPQTGKSEPNFAYGYVAQGITIEVDTETGQIKILEVISVNDVGRAINPSACPGTDRRGCCTSNRLYHLGEFYTERWFCIDSTFVDLSHPHGTGCTRSSEISDP